MCNLKTIVEKLELSPDDILAFKVTHKLDIEDLDNVRESVDRLNLPCKYMVIPYDIEISKISQNNSRKNGTNGRKRNIKLWC